MARGNRIIVSSNPQGKFDEGVISGTPKPGTIMELVPSTEMVGGRFTYRASTAVDGAVRPLIVLLPDDLQGKLNTDAYVSGTRGFLYTPLRGEELNILMRRQAGTGTAGIENIGDKLEVDQTGMLQALTTSSPPSIHATPFTLLEHGGVALTGDALVHVRVD